MIIVPFIFVLQLLGFTIRSSVQSGDKLEGMLSRTRTCKDLFRTLVEVSVVTWGGGKVQLKAIFQLEGWSICLERWLICPVADCSRPTTVG